MTTTKSTIPLSNINDDDDDNNNNNNEKTTITNANTTTTPEEDSKRFEIELEFVQCLASPSYLNFLAQNEYFDSPDFIAYLNYLQYWRIPRYSRFVIFPHALYFLQLLQDTTFRDAIKRDDFALMVHQQQGWNWQFEKSFNKQQKSASETVNASHVSQQQQQQQSQQQQGEVAGSDATTTTNTLHKSTTT